MREFKRWHTLRFGDKVTELKRKNTTRYFYNLKVVDLGDSIEIYKYNYWIERNKTKNSRGSKKEKDNDLVLTDEMINILEVENKMRSLRRTKDKLIKVLEMNKHKFTSFITLTFAEDIGIDESKKELKKFFRKLTDNQEDFCYCYVLELTKNLRPHYHILCNYNIPIQTVRGNKKRSQEQKDYENDFSQNIWGNGFAFLGKVESELGVIKYLTDYLTKDLDHTRVEKTKNKRLYGYSKNLDKPVYKSELVDYTKTEIYNYYSQFGEIEYMSEYGEGNVCFMKFKKNNL